MKKIVISVAVVVAIILVAAFVPMVEAEYRHTETYLEDEPYEVTETHTVTAPVSYEVVDSYVFEDTYTYHYSTQVGGFVWEGTEEVPIEVAAVVIRNIDDHAGSFTVSFSGFTAMFFESVTLDLSFGQEGTANCPSEYDIVDWSYDVTPSTKQVDEERTVTKYRQVERERLVIEYRTVPIFEYLRSRFQD